LGGLPADADFNAARSADCDRRRGWTGHATRAAGRCDEPAGSAPPGDRRHAPL